MQRIAIILLSVVAALGAVLWLTRAKPVAPAQPPPAWVGLLDAGSVRSVRSQDGRGVTAEVLRAADDRLWLLHAQGTPAWTVSTDRVRAALRLVQDGAARAAVPSEAAAADAVRVTFQIDGVGSRTVLIEPEGIGGLRRMHLPSESGDSCRDCLVDAGLAQVLSPEGMQQWRDPAAVWTAATDPARVKIDAGGSVLSLSRNAGRWLIQSPVACPADAEAVAALLGALSGVSFQRVLPADERGFAGLESPAAVITLETDVRVAEGSEVRRRVLVQELRIGGGSAAAGGTLTAQGVATWRDPERNESSAGWGPMLVQLKADALKGITAQAEPLLSRVTFQTPRADVRELGLGEGPEGSAGGGASRAARVVLKRTLGGWSRAGATGESALGEADAGGLAEVLTMLCETRASAATLTGLREARALATVKILREGAAQETAEIGLATVPLATGAAEAVVVKSGGVWRVYPAGAHAGAVAFLRRMLPTEG